eukprot:g8824.t1
MFGSFVKVSDVDRQLLQLLPRVEEASTIVERVSALNDLKELLTNTPSTKELLVRSTNGISILSKTLANREDSGVVHGALEVLLLLTGSTEEASNGGQSVNVGVFCESSDRLVMLLSLFEPEPIGIEDFYVHYNAIQLLRNCLSLSKNTLKDVVSKNGTGGLLRMLNEREAIRNEVVLILTKLAEDETRIQNSLVQSGVFQKLFDIIQGEGGCEGGIVVQDCLELISVLLKNNEITQKQFRELGYFQFVLKYLQLVDVKLSGAGALLTANQSISKQKLMNLKTLISATVHLLDATLPLDTITANSNAFNTGDCLPVFSQLCLNEGGVSDLELRMKALHSISQVLRHSKEAKGLFMKLRVFWNGQPTEAIQAVMKIIFNANEKVEAMSARSVLIGFFHGFPEGQLWILGNIQAPSSAFFDIFYTMETVKDGLELGKRATQIMMTVVKGNSQIQGLFASNEMPVPNRAPIKILKWMMELLKYCVEYGSDQEQCHYLVELVVCCIEKNPTSVEILIQDESNMSFLFTKSQEALNPLINEGKVESLTSVSFILASCLETVILETHHPNSQALRDYLTNIIQSSIGIENFLLMIEALSNVLGMEIVGSCLLTLKSYFQPKEALRPKEESTDKTQEELMKAQDQIQELRKRNGELSDQLTQTQSLVQQQQTEIDVLRKQLADKDSIKNDLFACLGLQDMKLKALSQKLNSLGFDPGQVILSSDFNSLQDLSIEDKTAH